MPRPHLSRAKIVAAAVELADDKGLDAVTLRGLAKRLDVHVTSLYNYIPTKEALFREMMLALVAESGLPVDAGAWQDWVRSFAVSMRALANRHPGAFQLFQAGPAQGMRAMESLESAVAAFRSDGFDEVSTYCAIKTVSVAVLGLALDDLVRHRKPAIDAEIEQLPADRFPNIAGIHAVARNADTFDFVLDALIEGISAKRQDADT